MNEPIPVPKVALVTGAARRIGAIIAVDLAAQGWTVAVHYHGAKDAADGVVDTIRSRGGTAQAFAADFHDEAEVRRLSGDVRAAFGPFDLLVNNASVFRRDSILDHSRALWDSHMAVNLRAPLVLTEDLVRHLPEDGRGNVVNILDQRVWNPTPHFMSYTVSRAGLWTLTQTLALSLAPRIRVNAIGPGPTLRTEGQSAEHFARQCRSVPLERQTQPEEIAQAIRFILAAPAMTGQMIALDGGQHLGWAHPSPTRPDQP
ncbi:MAG: SDR family oxidoreductase [Pseudomonadales bacterium]|nr:SDR family oxidoreductase [Pseudomonadales bacterium]